MRLKSDQFLKNILASVMYNLEPLPLDASFRRYNRVRTVKQNLILMDYAPEHGSLRPFIQMSEWLTKSGFSAPQIYNVDYENGYALIEDFGVVHFKDYLQENDTSIYYLAIDLLIALHKLSPPSWLAEYSTEILLDEELRVFIEYYPNLINLELSKESKNKFYELWREVLISIPQFKPVVVLQDYHAQNIMHLQERHGIAALGLLDFQDAYFGSPFYDIASLLEDARLTVPKLLANDLLDYYIKQTRLEPEASKTSYMVLAAQRNMRILGYFARQKIAYNNPKYLEFIPRVLGYLEQDLSHSALGNIAQWCGDNISF